MVTSDKRGREVILATLSPGDYIGEMSLIDNEPHSATCRAEVQTDMLTLGPAEFARCLPENSSMSYAIMKGLVVYDHLQRMGEMTKTLGGWIRKGEFRWREDVAEGLESAPEAFCRLMRGGNFGKALVRVGPEKT